MMVLQVDLYADSGSSATLQGTILQSATSPYTMAVDAIAGMVIGGYVVINDEMFQVVSFPGHPLQLKLLVL